MSRAAGPPASVAEGGPEGAGAGSDLASQGAYRIELPEFEGPLDLLLHLCKTHELDILQIPIAFVTEKYLAYLEAMQAMSVEVAAEYLVMAATLAYLKARELVPNPEPLEATAEEGEDAIDPREELIRRLLEYQRYKDAAEQLGGRPVEGRNIFPRGIKLEGPGAPAQLAEHSVWRLIESFADILKNAGPKVTHDVLVDKISLGDRINHIIDRLEGGGGSFRFDTLIPEGLPEGEVKHQLVVSLLAILELAKLRVIRVLLDELSDHFYIAARDGVSLEAARRAQGTSDRVEEPEAEAEGAGEAGPPGRAAEADEDGRAAEADGEESAPPVADGEESAPPVADGEESAPPVADGGEPAAPGVFAAAAFATPPDPALAEDEAAFAELEDLLGAETPGMGEDGFAPAAGAHGSEEFDGKEQEDQEARNRDR